MHTGNQLAFLKVDWCFPEHVQFMTANLNPTYTSLIGQWQYPKSNRLTGLFFVTDHGRIVGSQGMIPVLMDAGGCRILTVKSETSFLLPENRGQGLFEKLYDHAANESKQDGAFFIWGFTAVTKVWKNKLGFDVHSNLVQESILQISLWSEIRMLLRKDMSILDKSKAMFKSCLGYAAYLCRFHYSSSEVEIAALDLSNGEDIKTIEKIYEAWILTKPDLVSICLNVDYIAWRLRNNPVRKYQSYGFYVSNKLIGFAILGVSSHKAHLVEFIVLDDTLIGSCLNQLISELKTTSLINSLVYWASGSNTYCRQIHDMLKSVGAKTEVNRFMNFVFKELQETGNHRYQIHDFYINGLWTEGFEI